MKKSAVKHKTEILRADSIRTKDNRNPQNKTKAAAAIQVLYLYDKHKGATTALA